MFTHSSFTNMTVKHGQQILNPAEFQYLNDSQFCLFQNQFRCAFEMIVMLDYPHIDQRSG